MTVEDNKNSSDPEMTSGAKLMLDDFKKYEDEIKQLRKENEELKERCISWAKTSDEKNHEIAELKNTVQKLSDALASTMTPNQ